MGQRVVAHYQLDGGGFGDREQRQEVFTTERALRAAVEQAGVGEVDGNEFGGGRVAIYAYGPDADALYAVMEPELRALSFRPAHVNLVYSDESDARIDL